MHASVLQYLRTHIEEKDIREKGVIEVGSYDVNGSPRSIVLSLHPKTYLGIDQQKGPGVDQVVNAGDLAKVFGSESFDVVLSTEMLEHALDWKTVVSNMKALTKFDGLLIVTARSPGFPYHGFPEDHWRFTLEDFGRIFGDMEIIDLSSDPDYPGVFMKARKQKDSVPIDLATIQVARAPSA